MSETAPPPSGPGIFADVMEVAAPIADLPTLFDAELAVSSLLGGAYAAADTGATGREQTDAAAHAS